MFKAIYNIASSAMSASRLRINTIASNIANAQTTRTQEGGPYKRRDVILASSDIKKAGFDSALDEASLKGVQVASVVVDDKPPKLVFDPGHPDADPKTGMVAMPNINPVTEMANLISASAAYKAAAEVAGVSKDMSRSIQRLAERF